jgi:hypothetical protein
MARKHLFEFIDQRWFPEIIRNYETDFLQFLSNKTKLFVPIAPALLKGLKKTNGTQILDLGSGGGGAFLSLNEELIQQEPRIQIQLSDYYPNKEAFQFTINQVKNITAIDESVDARNVPKELTGFRTLFLTFHHFRPADAKAILQNAIDSKAGIAIIEAQERSFKSILAMSFSWLSVLITTPFIRPFSFGRILFTYIIPIVPIFTVWDGIVSSLRTYSEEELKQMVSTLERSDEFDWEISRLKSGPGALIYLIGTPKQS